MKMRRCDDCPSDVDVELLDRLKDWRRSAAKEQQVPAYVVFTDATLTAIAEQRPADTSALVAIPGIGANKLDRYGEAVLASRGRRRRPGEPVVNRLCTPQGCPYCRGPRERIRAS